MKKNSIFLSILIFTSICASSQTLKVFEEWTTSSGTQNMFLETFTETDASGNVYVGGATVNASGDYDILLTKYDRRGTLQWTEQYAGTGYGDDAASAICFGDSGNVYLTGTVYTSVDNKNDCVVLKYDQYGDLKWARTYNGNGTGDDFGIDICIDANDNVYIGGSCTQLNTYFDFLVLKYDRGGTYQWVSFYNNLNLFDIANKIALNGSSVFVAGGTQVNATKWEYAVAEYSASNGSYLGVKTTTSTGSGIDQINDLYIDANGNIYVTGGVVNAGTGYDYRTVKLNDSLDVQWTATYNGDDDLDDIARSVQVDANGNVFVTGYSLTQNEDTNLVTIKYNSSGVEQWTEEFNNDFDGCDKGEALAIDDSGNIYVAATYFNGSNSDYLTIKYNTDGDLQWKMTYNGLYNQNDEAKDICLDDEGDIIVVGQSYMGDEYHYIAVKYSEIDVIIPPDEEAVSTSFSYIENNGQLLNTSQNPASDVKFYSTSSSQKIYFEDESISFVLSKMIGQPDTCSGGDTIQYHKCEMLFHEADPYIKVRAFDQRDDYFNYYLAHIPEGRARVPNYEKVIYSELFEGIDLLFSGNNKGWKCYFIIKPGADPSNIEFAFAGADSMYINGSDKLILATSLSDIVFPQGVAYQMNSLGNKIPLVWQPEYELDGNTINFSTDSYDTSKPLVFELKQGNATLGISSIDNLEWSTYYGEGTYYNGFYAVETNVSDSIWIVGSTSNSSFPVINGNSYGYFGDFDAVLLNFTYEGERNWAIFYGGSGNEYIDERHVKKTGLTVDNLGNSYIAGGTSSPEIPLLTPPGAYLDSVNAGREIFIAKFNNKGKLSWSTFFGDDSCSCRCITASYDLKLDNNNNLYVTGIVGGTPQVSPYTYITWMDAFIAEFNPAHELIWSTNYGGTWIDIIRDIAFDSNNDLYLTGETYSHDFPVSDPGNGYFYDNTLYDTSDAFIAKIYENHDTAWAMYLGCDTTDTGTGICIDDNDNIFICGVTYTRGLPVFDMGWPAYYEQLPLGNPTDTFDYNGDGFLAKFTNAGERLHCTYYGGLSGEGFSDIGVDGNGNVYVTGTSGSSSLPFADPAVPNFYVDSTKLNAQDGIILSFNSDLKLQWTTYFGGDEINPGDINRDWVTGLTISDDNLNLFVVGETNSSSDFPWVQLSNAYFDTVPSLFEGFISRFNIGGVINIESIPALYNNILVYPNPATTALYIHSDKEIDSYHIYNITGQLIKSGKYTGAIPIAKLSQGIYLMKISVGSKTANAKFIKN